MVPLRVTVFTLAPTKFPCRTSNGATFTCTCSIAWSEIGATPDLSPGVLPSPNELLKYEPSTWMLLSRESCPAKDIRPPDCGVSRVTFSRRPLMFGRFDKSERLMVVAAPVRFDENTGSVWPVTVTCSETAMVFTSIARSVATPRLTVTFSIVFGAKAVPWPTKLTLTA